MSGPHILIVEAKFYTELAEAQAQGAIAEIEKAGGTWERLVVPGALEIPGAISLAAEAVWSFEEAGGSWKSDDSDVQAAAGKIAERRIDGYIALGCVIRGETTHYEIVSEESARGIMDLTVQQGLAIGNGILTVENQDQAWDRADPARKDKGGDAARAALRMIELRQRFVEAS